MREEMKYYEDKLERNVASYKVCGLCIVGILFLILFSLLLSGCSPDVITVEKVHTEYVNKTDTVTINDTVRCEKSTVIREANEGDSAMLALYGIRLRENERMLLFLQQQLERESSESWEVSHDTVLVCDTIPQKVEVEKELSWWERQKIAFGELAMVVMFVLLCLLLIRLKLK